MAAVMMRAVAVQTLRPEARSPVIAIRARAVLDAALLLHRAHTGLIIARGRLGGETETEREHGSTNHQS